MDLQLLGTLQAIAFVVAATLIGTALHCGLKAARQTLALLFANARNRFDAQHTRSILAYHAARISKDGVLRASERSCGDSGIDACIDVLVRRRSVTAMYDAAKGKHTAKGEARDLARQTLESAADLAPVMGLAGTLLALMQLPSGGIGAAGLMPTVAMAVQTTLFGLALAHIVFHPLARWIDRRISSELDARKELLDWFFDQIEHAVPSASREPVSVRKLAPRVPPQPANQPFNDDWAV